MDAGANTFILFITEYLSNVRDEHDVGKNACRRDIGAGTVALDQHRMHVVAFRSQEDDVVRAVQHIEGMLLGNFAEGDGIFPVLHLGDKTPAFALFLEFPSFFLESGIQGRELLPEFLKLIASSLPIYQKKKLHLVMNIDLWEN